MKTLQQLCPEIGTEQLRLIWREVEAAIPEKKKYVDFADKETDNMDATYVGGHNEAIAEFTERIKQFIGAEPMLDRLNRGEG